MKRADLIVLPVLDTRRLFPTVLKILSKLSKHMIKLDFGPVLGMAKCLARRPQGAAIFQVFGLPNLAILRSMFALKLVVSNRCL